MDDRLQQQQRRAEQAIVDITWVSCRGVRSSIPFHTPCLYTSIYLTSSSSSSNGRRRRHRVKTPTDRSGGRNPEWDQRLRLYVDADDGLLVRFDLKAEVAVLGDLLTASAVVPVSDLVADGQTRRVSYQLLADGGKQPNGVISFSYTFHESTTTNKDDDDRSSISISDSEPPAAPLLTAAAFPSSPQSVSSGGMYPAIDWSSPAQLTAAVIYPPPPRSSNYYPRPRPPPVDQPVTAIYPPSSVMETSTTSRCIYAAPAVREHAASGMYPTVELAPVICYPPSTTVYAPEWDARSLYG